MNADSILALVWCRRLIRFCVVGVSGVLVNMGILVALTEGFGVPYLVSSLFAIELSILSNFALNDAWTWAGQRRSGWFRRLLKFHAVAGLTALTANWALLILFTRLFSLDYRVANLIGIAAGTTLNFSMNSIWTFRLARNVDSTGTDDAWAGPSKTATGELLQDFQLSYLVIAVLVVLTTIKLIFASTAELFPEEAYYWTYWQHPATGYFDHPPMVAWMIGFGTALFGDTELGVRFGPIVLSIGSAILVWHLTRLWFDRKAAWWAMLLFTLLPLSIGIGTLAFPDAPLIFFWLSTLWAISKALGRGRASNVERTTSWIYWVLAGAVAGCALLSKYTAVMIFPSIVLFLFCSRTYRQSLWHPQPWLASLIALLVFSPVIWWNAHHEWASFLFQSSRAGEKAGIGWKTASECWLLQMGILGPGAFIFLSWSVTQSFRKAWRARDDRSLFALAFFVPLFFLFAAASFKTRIRLNWTAPAFCSLLPSAAAIVYAGLAGQLRFKKQTFRWLLFSVGTLAFALLAVSLTTIFLGVPEKLVPSHSIGWRTLAAEVLNAQKDSEHAVRGKPFVLGADKYNLAAELGFYLHAPNDAVNNLALCKTALGYRYWTDLRSFSGRCAIIVFKGADEASSPEVRRHFDHVDAPKPIQVASSRRKARTFWIAEAHKYRTHKPEPDRDAGPIDQPSERK